jgi:hypothetical protein
MRVRRQSKRVNLRRRRKGEGQRGRKSAKRGGKQRRPNKKKKDEGRKIFLVILLARSFRLGFLVAHREQYFSNENSFQLQLLQMKMGSSCSINFCFAFDTKKSQKKKERARTSLVLCLFVGFGHHMHSSSFNKRQQLDNECDSKQHRVSTKGIVSTWGRVLISQTFFTFSDSEKKRRGRQKKPSKKCIERITRDILGLPAAFGKAPIAATKK